MRIIILVLLWIVPLVNSLTAQDGTADVNFDNFCTHFDELRSRRDTSALLRDLGSIRDQLQALGLAPQSRPVVALEEPCRDPSRTFNPECLYRNRHVMTRKL